MADVFISYAREDRPAAQSLAQMLAGQGYTVWWDRELGAGDEFSAVIEQALDGAKAVLVLWSEASRKSHWVRDEAAVGRDRNRLIPLLLDEALPPLGFRQIHTVSANDAQNDERIRASFLGAISSLCGRTATQPPAQAPQGTVVAGVAAPVDKPLKQILAEEQRQRAFAKSYWLKGMPLALIVGGLVGFLSQIAETYPFKSFIGNFIFGFVLASLSLGVGRLFIVAGRRLAKRKSVRYFDQPTLLTLAFSGVFAAAIWLIASMRNGGVGDSGIAALLIAAVVFPVFALITVPVGVVRGLTRTSFEDGA